MLLTRLKNFFENWLQNQNMMALYYVRRKERRMRLIEFA